MAGASKNTKERLINTAMDLIWKSSYGAVSVDDICKAAKVNKGSFYHYFPSKIDLATAAMQEAYNQFRPILDQIFSPSIPPIERFEKYAEMGYEHQKEIADQHGMVCGCPFVTLASEMAPQDETIRSKTEEIIAIHQKYYETTLRDMVAAGLLSSDTDVSTKASKIYTFVMGQLMLARIQNNLGPMKRDFRAGLFRMIGIKQDITEVA
ncbi:MAG: TetR/AcrR family transcriptional regulator [Bdellovibrionales bacterium]